MIVIKKLSKVYRDKFKDKKITDLSVIPTLEQQVEQGQELKQGDRIGMLRDGSRVVINFKNN